MNTFKLIEDAFQRTEVMNYLFHFMEHSNCTATRKITKWMPAVNELSVSIYLSMPRTKTNLNVRGDSQIFMGYLKLFRFISQHYDEANNKYSEQRKWKQKVP